MLINLTKLPYVLLCFSSFVLTVIGCVLYLQGLPGQTSVLLFSALIILALAGFYYYTIDFLLIRALRVSPVLYIVAIWLIFTFSMAIPIYFMLYLSPVKSFFVSSNALTTTALPLSNTWRFNTPGFLIWHDYCQWIGGYLTLISFWVLSYTRRFRAIEKRLNRRLANSHRDGIETSQIPQKLCLIYLIFSFCVALVFSSLSGDILVGIRSGLVLPATGSIFFEDMPNAIMSAIALEFIASLVMLLSVSGFLWVLVITLASNRVDGIRREQTTLIYAILAAISGIAIFIFILPNALELPRHMVYLTTLTEIFSSIATGYFRVGETEHMLTIPAVMLLCLIGGVSISTSGGIKFSRLIYLANQIKNSLLVMIYPNLTRVGMKNSDGDIQRSRRIWMIVTSAIVVVIFLLCLFGAEGAEFEYAILNATAIASNAGGILDYAPLGRGQSVDVEQILVYSEITTLLSALLMIIARLEFVFVFSLAILLVRTHREVGKE